MQKKKYYHHEKLLSIIILKKLFNQNNYLKYFRHYFFLFFIAMKLHINIKKKIKQIFDAIVKFVFKELKRNVNICIYGKMNFIIL